MAEVKSEIALSEKYLVWGLSVASLLWVHLFRLFPHMIGHKMMRMLSLTHFEFNSALASYFVAYLLFALVIGFHWRRFSPVTWLFLAWVLHMIGAFLSIGSQSWQVFAIGRFVMGAGAIGAYTTFTFMTLNYFEREKFSNLFLLGTGIMFGGVALFLPPLRLLSGYYGMSFVQVAMGISGFCILVGIIFASLRAKKYSITWVSADTPLPTYLDFKKRLGNAELWWNALAAFCFYAPTAAASGIWMTSFIKHSYDVPMVVAAYTSTLFFFGWAIGCFCFCQLNLDNPRRINKIIGSQIIALITFFLVIYHPGLTRHSLVPLLFFFGFFSSAELSHYVLAVENDPDPHKELTILLIIGMVAFGGMIILPLLGFLLERSINNMSVGALLSAPQQTYQTAFFILICSLIGAIFSSLVLRKKMRQRALTSKQVAAE